MKKHLIRIGTLLLLSAPVIGQTGTETTTEFKPSGKIDGKIYADFYSTIDAPTDASAFEIKRAYLGYTYNLAPEWSARVLFDIGDDESFLVNTTGKTKSINRYAFFKNAALFYTKDKLKVGFGLQDTYNMKTQEKVWGKRYVEKSFLDLNKFANTADMGITAQYSLDAISFDLGIYNGEGFKSNQKDNAYRTAIGATASLLDQKLLIRLGDEYEDNGIALNTVTLFAGYVAEKFSVGAEFEQQTNYAHIEDDDRSGISLFGSVDLSSKFSVFARYDQLSADDNLVESEYMLGGLEYKIIKNLRGSVNLKNVIPEVGDSSLYGFLNLEVVF